MRILALVLSFLATTASAHEFWIEPLAYQVEPEGRLEAHLVNGQDFAGTKIPYLPRGFANFLIFTDANTAARVTGRAGDLPALITAVIFRDGSNSYEAFSQKASYLFEKSPRDEWYNYAQRTMECTKKMMGLKLYLSLKNYGTDIFRAHIEQTHDLTGKFAEMIREQPDFELATGPQSNIICFRYIIDGLDVDVTAARAALCEMEDTPEVN